MRKLASFDPKIFVFTGFVFLLMLACNAPGIGGAASRLDSAEQTAQALETSIGQTQAAMLNSPIAQTIQVVTSTPQPVTPTLPVEATHVSGITATPTIYHNIIPGEPGKVKAEIKDANTAPSGSLKHAKEGDIYQQNLFERPFNSDMLYRPDLDIQKAELSEDDNFFYVTIYLVDVHPDSKTLRANYGIELDTDFDGRGDYMILVAPPFEEQWQTNNVSAFGDSNNDVGRKRALIMDFPSSGDGYDVVIFTVQNNRDPDLVWGRKAPEKSSAVQIAFKKSMLDHPSSFLFGVWADDGLKDVRMFDYNDNFSEADAGSPLEKNPNYPLKELFAVDNTCRMSFGRALLVTDPGVCVEQKPPIPTLRVPTVQVTLPSGFPGSGN